MANEVPLEGARDKAEERECPMAKDGSVMFEVLAPQALEIPRGKLSWVLEEAGMADESFIRRMVADLKDAGDKKLLAQGATPRENQERMLQHLMRVRYDLAFFSLPW